MASIAIVNHKGGCGKTTTAINLAAAYARQRRKVLVIDMDPQGHVSMGLNIDSKKLPLTIYDVLSPLKKNPGLKKAIVRITPFLDLIPANVKLSALEQQLAGTTGRESILRDILNPYLTKYDFIFIDCPPNLGLLSINAIMAVDNILIPVESSKYCLEGVSDLTATLEMIDKKAGHKPRRFIFNTLTQEKSDYESKVVKNLKKKYGKAYLKTRIRESVRIKEAAFMGKPIVYMDLKDRGAVDYYTLSEILGKKLGFTPITRINQIKGAVKTKPLSEEKILPMVKKTKMTKTMVRKTTKPAAKKKTVISPISIRKKTAVKAKQRVLKAA